MDEFSLIDTYFKSIVRHREDVIFGIGDDAACLSIPTGMQLLVSTDTFVENIHFLSSWDACDIASRAVRATISDIAAMGGKPCWLTLALTIPTLNENWLASFSKGLKEVLDKFDIALIGGDTTHGPMSITLTIHGVVPNGKAIRRKGASPGDIIYVSGELGGAMFALACTHNPTIDPIDKHLLMNKLLHPEPRVDLINELQFYATAAIDISDGLSVDLEHICKESQVGARLVFDRIPLHPLIKKYQTTEAIDFALSGGDDYELCFTVAPANESAFLSNLAQLRLNCYPIGVIEATRGLRGVTATGEVIPIIPRGYNHF